MAGEVIQFPGKREVQQETVRTPQALFSINEDGVVDLVEGVSVSDAVEGLWGSLQGVVKQAWADAPLGREKARTRLLCAYLDKVRPGWREELAWTV